jgi:hypothetical protein
LDDNRFSSTFDGVPSYQEEKKTMITSLFNRRSLKKNTRKSVSSRRQLNLGMENLDGRVLLAGNVLAQMTTPTSGILQIKDQPGGASNQIKIAIVPASSPLLLRVQGVSTSVNSVAFVDFVASSISSIDIQMTNGGSDRVDFDATNFKVLNLLNFKSDGTGADVFTTNRLTSNQVTISANVLNTAGATVKMLSPTVSGQVLINTGNGSDDISLVNGTSGGTGVKIGTLRIDTAGSSYPGDTVTITDFTTVGSVPGIGQLFINSTFGDHRTTIKNTSMTTLAITANGGNNFVSVTSPLIRQSASYKNLSSGYDDIDFQANSVKTLNIDTDSGFYDRVNVHDTVVTGPNPIASAALEINADAYGADVFLFNVTVNSGDINIKTDDYSAIYLYSVFDGGEITINSVDDTRAIVVYDTDAESLHIQNGLSTMLTTYFNINSSSFIGGDGVSLVTDDGTHDIYFYDVMIDGGLIIQAGYPSGTGDNNVTLDYLTVLDGMFINLSNGINTVSVFYVQVDYGAIIAGAGINDLFINDPSSNSWGFFVVDFEGFI